MMTLMENSPVPLYLQLEQELRKRISGGEFEIHSMLPSEQELIDLYGVSRTTVRQALHRLAEDDVIVKVQGKGTFVKTPPIRQELVSLQTISEVLTGAGLLPEVRVLSVEMEPEVSADIFSCLQLGPDEPVLRIRRQHLVDGEPVAYAVIYLSGKFQWRFSAQDLAEQSIYSWLEEKSSIVVSTGYQVIKAKAATDEVASALDLARGEPVLHVENTSTTVEGVPIEHTEFYFPPERYALTVTLRRTHAGVSLENVEAGLRDEEPSA